MSHVVLMQTGSSKLVGFKQSLAPDNIISSNTQVATGEELAVGTPVPEMCPYLQCLTDS
jgi:hypothetical protein